ncbi:MAG: LytR C-terminal domain-containing protein [Endomicrobium sp.]|nr:LytR C-terminal domain-containing protein [Endomicrobium sp.]
MFQMTKKIIKILILILFVLITAAVSAYIYVCRNDIVAKKLKDKDYISFSVLLHGTEKMFPGRLDAYTVLYNKKTNILKVLSVNTDAVVFKKREKSRSLKTLFNENSKKDINTAIKKFYLDLREVIGNAVEADFYINTSFETLYNMTWKNKKFKAILSKDNFKNRDLESLNRLETIEHFLNLTPYMIMKICKNYDFINTNIPKLPFAYYILRLKFIKQPVLIFCEMPVKYTKTRVEFDRQNIEELLNKIYYADATLQTNTKDILINIKNASRKPRMAEKAAWLLRKNNFDVLDWNNFSITYDKTLIKDYKGNFMQALEIAEILKTGKVIVSYDNCIYSDINIFVGKDCIIYDNLDKKERQNGKN